jgi:nucleotide-binding universal stress UspA family protein
MFKTILAATDGSGHSDRAIETAADIASQYGARLVIVNVVQNGPIPDQLVHMAQVEHLVDLPEASPPPRVTDVPATIAGIRPRSKGTARLPYAIADRIVENAKRTARDKGVKDIKSELPEGEPVKCILDSAQQNGADAIVMGSRGLSEIKGLLMGSVSHKICQLSRCTCITVK